MERPLDELEKLILRHLASGPSSAADLTDALRQYGVTPSRPAVVYRLGGLVSLKLVTTSERKDYRRIRHPEFIYSLRAEVQAEPKVTTEAAPPSVEVQAEPKAEPAASEPPKAEPPKEDAPPAQVSPKTTKGASKSPSSARQDGPPKLAPAPREIYPQGREDYIRQRRAALVRAGLIKGASRCTR